MFSLLALGTVGARGEGVMALFHAAFGRLVFCSMIVCCVQFVCEHALVQTRTPLLFRFPLLACVSVASRVCITIRSLGKGERRDVKTADSRRNYFLFDTLFAFSVSLSAVCACYIAVCITIRSFIRKRGATRRENCSLPKELFSARRPSSC